jgi:hypothetical protein
MRPRMPRRFQRRSASSGLQSVRRPRRPSGYIPRRPDQASDLAALLGGQRQTQRSRVCAESSPGPRPDRVEHAGRPGHPCPLHQARRELTHRRPLPRRAPPVAAGLLWVRTRVGRQRTARSWSWPRSRRSRVRNRLISRWTCRCWALRRENSAAREAGERRYSATSALTEVPRSAARILAVR